MALKIKAYTFTVNHIGDREAVTVENRCELVEISQLVSSSPKQNYSVSDVPSGGESYEMAPGTTRFIPAGKRGFFSPGETILYAATTTASVPFQRLEHLIEP